MKYAMAALREEVANSDSATRALQSMSGARASRRTKSIKVGTASAPALMNGLPEGSRPTRALHASASDST